MRTAEEIIKWAFDNTPANSRISDVYIIAVNEARKECIEECAEICREHRDSGCFDGEGAEANILNLIKELK